MSKKYPVVRSAVPFDVEKLLASTVGLSKVTHYVRDEQIFSQGDKAVDVRYIQSGAVKISVLSRVGREAVVAMLGTGDFFGEAALAGQATRIETASAIEDTSVLCITVDTMTMLLRDQPDFAARFLAHMLARNIRVEADLVDQLFNSSEKRLARTLLLLSRYGNAHATREIPRVSQETLAEMIGTTRSRVNFFMNKFRKMGLIEYNGTLKINAALLSVVLHD
jgi:CRP-like cAMP-binding protein